MSRLGPLEHRTELGQGTGSPGPPPRAGGRPAQRLHPSDLEQIAKTHGAICIEDLAVKNMVKNRYLARSIIDAAWGNWTPAAYKADWYGATLAWPPVLRLDQDLLVVRVASEKRWRWRARLCVRGLWSGCDRDTNAAANLAAWARPSIARSPRPRTPKRWAGSPKPVEGGALAVTSVTVELLPKAPIRGRSRNRSPHQRPDRTPEKGGQQMPIR